MTPEPAPRWPALALAAVGLGLCGYLEHVHLQTFLAPLADTACRVSERFDCSTVARSRFAVVLGVPLPILGAAGLLAIAYAAWRRSWLVLPLSATALAISLALLVEALVHVRSICLACEGVHLVSLGLFVHALAVRRRLRREISIRDLVPLVLVPLALVLTAIAFVPRYWLVADWQHGFAYPYGQDDDGHPWIGAASPRVTVHEYIDYACPHCAIATARTRARLARDPDAIRLVRHQQPRMPCTPGTASCVHARAALCAQAQGKFWEMDSWLFLHAPGNPRLDPLRGAARLGLDAAAFASCLTAEETYARADRDFRDAMKQRIRGTPGYVVDGRRIEPSSLFEVIATALR